MNVPFGVDDLVKALPFLAVFLFSLAPITIKVLSANREPQGMGSLLQGLGGLFAGLILLGTVYGLVSRGGNPVAFDGAIIIDGLTMWVGLIAIAAGGASLILMHENRSTSGNQFAELVFLTLSCVLGMLILISGLDLIVMFIGLEMMSLALYLMIGMSQEQKLAKEAALKYFLFGSFASAIFLFGVSFIFGTVGSTSLSDIIDRTPDLFRSSQLFALGLLFLILGFCFKVSIAPFHAWTPDVYQGAPTPHSALMSTAVKAVSFAAFLRIMLTRGVAESQNLFDILQWLAVVTMLIGNLAALVQTNVKRILAYSSVAHSGYLLVGLITSGVSGSPSVAASGVVFYLIAYSLMTLGAFAVVGLIEKDENSQITLDNLAGYSKVNPPMALALTIFLLSLAGIPPTVGFFGKFYLFSNAIGEGLLWLSLWGVLNSALGVYYYLKPIVFMFMKEPVLDSGWNLDPKLGTRTLVILFAILVVALGISSGSLFDVVELVLS